MKKFVGIIMFIMVIITITNSFAVYNEEKHDKIYDDVWNWTNKNKKYSDFIFEYENTDGYEKYIALMDSDYFVTNGIDYENIEVLSNWFEREFPKLIKIENEIDTSCEIRVIGFYNETLVYMLTINYNEPMDGIIGVKYITSFY